MRRRELITLLGGAAAWPFAASAQQPTMPAVGFIHILSAENVPHIVAAFRQGLSEAGMVEGQNVAVEYRWAEGNYDRLPGFAADLVHRHVAVIAAAGGEPSPQVVKAATQTIPIVFTANGDPVRDGLVASLSRPGGNATGITIFGGSAVTKRLQLLHEIVPKVSIIVYLMNPSNPNAESEMRAARTRLIMASISDPSGLRPNSVPSNTSQGANNEIASLARPAFNAGCLPESESVSGCAIWAARRFSLSPMS